MTKLTFKIAILAEVSSGKPAYSRKCEKCAIVVAWANIEPSPESTNLIEGFLDNVCLISYDYTANWNNANQIYKPDAYKSIWRVAFSDCGQLFRLRQEKKRMERVIGTDELQTGERRSIFVDDVPALVIRIESEYFVIEDVCSHDGQPLTTGPIEGCTIICPRHAARFDLKTGKALCMPATDSIRVFRTEIRDGVVWAEPV